MTTSLALPRIVGSVSRQTATQLAETALDLIGQLRNYGKNKKPIAYGVCMDIAGRVVIERLADAPHRELLMACTKNSDPDDLAELIRDEAKSRDNTRKRGRKPK